MQHFFIAAQYNKPALRCSEPTTRVSRRCWSQSERPVWGRRVYSFSYGTAFLRSLATINTTIVTIPPLLSATQTKDRVAWLAPALRPFLPTVIESKREQQLLSGAKGSKACSQGAKQEPMQEREKSRDGAQLLANLSQAIAGWQCATCTWNHKILKD